MSDLIEDPAPGGANAPEFTVSEISGAVKRMIEGEFGRVRVRGEVGRVSRPASGHLYFDLKDDRAVLAAVSWKGQAARLSVRPEEGMEVIATGRLTTFPGQSKYQLIVEDLVPAGAGALMAMLEKRKARLAAEGLFAPERKQPIPYLPRVIGVVTSPSGAVIRDILHRLRDRFPRHVLIWPVAVQGEKCAPEVAAAIAGFNAIAPGGPVPRPDVLIVARGGGCVEDLWGFNEEVVVRAAAASRIPLISAVGHETDTTLIDYAADRRAPTPDRGGRDRGAGAAGTAGGAGCAGRAAEPGAEPGAGAARPAAARPGAGAAAARGAGRAGGPAVRSVGRAAAGRVAHRGGEEAGRVQHHGGACPAAAAWRSRRAAARAAGGPGRPPCPGAGAAAGAGHARPRAAGRPASARHAWPRLGRKRAALDLLSRRLAIAATAQTEGWRSRLDGLDRMRMTLGYGETLKRGFAVVRGDDRVVTSKVAAERATALEIEFHDGRLALTPRPGRKARHDDLPPEQGSLF